MNALSAPLAPLLVPGGRAYLDTLELELPFLLFEAIASLTTSTHLCYASDAPPLRRRLSSLSRDAMLAQRLIPLVLHFYFDPRKPTLREQYSLMTVELLPPNGVAEATQFLAGVADDASNGDSFATMEARERAVPQYKDATSFYAICTFGLAPDVPGRNDRSYIHTEVFRSTIRPDAFDKPARGSQDWFQYLRKKLSEPQPVYTRIGGLTVYQITEKEGLVALLETMRLIAVDKMEYPADKVATFEDPKISFILALFDKSQVQAQKSK